jgi:flavin reductase (DIM6/NTAB) family NADH-FMN oxidoreductase RutF
MDTAADFIAIVPSEHPLGVVHGHLLGAVAPRPIAFASTLDAHGRPNLAPFSYFNVFSTRPPVCVVGPNRSGRTGEHKHTLLNAQETGELVINIVNHAMVEQTSLASTEYPRGVNEFVKAGFTPLPSVMVKPARVAQSPVQLECTVRQIIELGTEGGAGNLIVCDIKLIHINKAVLNEHGRIDPQKIDLVGRMGADYYVRASGEAVFEVRKPVTRLGIGVDQLPARIRLSSVLTGNDLGKLGNTEQEEMPTSQAVTAFAAQQQEGLLKGLRTEADYHRAAHALLAYNRVADAWHVLLAYEYAAAKA